jgi:YidC/Oxa1 family membrane protein insertase
MDQNRLFIAIAISVAILLGFQFLMPRQPTPQHQAEQTTQSTPSTATPRPTLDPATPGTQPVAVAPPAEQRDVPRLQIAAAKVQGSVNLVGARLDDLVLRDYHVEVAPTSPLVRLLEPRVDPQPYYVQFGWTAEGDLKVPQPDTQWTASAPELTTTKPVTLSWDNGAGQVFEIALAVDDQYMFTVEQRVRNNSGAPVQVHPWARIRRDYKPVTAGYYILHEGMLGVLGGRLQEQTYDKAKTEAEKTNGPSLSMDTTGGWAGITDKYWLTALIPDQSVPVKAAFRHVTENGSDRYQVDFVTDAPETVAPSAQATSTTRLFAGAKVVQLLDRYETEYKLPNFDKAVDFGWFYFLTKPIFYALDWLYHLVGNFGVAILIFTVFVKLLFFPLANKSYKAMSKMKLLGPKMQEIRERFKDDPQKMQQEIMGMYRAEKVNPASGCLPMVIQIPVFFSLYKVIFVTIEMRHAPFFGWIRDLSAIDPTNVFNLFGLLPFDPAPYSHFLHLGAWPLIMGCTMFFQQRLNPPPPDPVQARIFQFMPIIFTFMLANFPAGLVIYWSWNNTLTILQQWTIMRRTSVGRPQMARS